MGDGDWCILRCSGPRTLKLAASLTAAGYDAWTPTASKRRRLSRGRKAKVEYDVPIAPTLVFVRSHQLHSVYAAMVDPRQPHPPFSIFQDATRRKAGVIRDSQLEGLRAVKRVEAAAAQARRDEDAAEEARVAAAEALSTERARRKALRATGKALKLGTTVGINNPAFTGIQFEVEQSTDKETVVTIGPGFRMKIETWMLLPNSVGAPLP